MFMLSVSHDLLFRPSDSAQCTIVSDMKNRPDARMLHIATQRHLRRTVVRAVRGGMSQTEASKVYRTSSASGKQVDDARANRWPSGAEAEATRTAYRRRTTAAGAIGAHPATDHRLAAGPIEAAVLSVDAGGSGEHDRERVRCFGIADHGRSLSGGLGHEPADAGAPGL